MSLTNGPQDWFYADDGYLYLDSTGYPVGDCAEELADAMRLVWADQHGRGITIRGIRFLERSAPEDIGACVAKAHDGGECLSQWMLRVLLSEAYGRPVTSAEIYGQAMAKRSPDHCEGCECAPDGSGGKWCAIDDLPCARDRL